MWTVLAVTPWDSLSSGMLTQAGELVTALLPLLAVPLGIALVGGLALLIRRVVSG